MIAILVSGLAAVASVMGGASVVALGVVTFATLAVVGHRLRAILERARDQLADASRAADAAGRRLDGVLTASSAAICALDRSRRVLHFNAAFAQKTLEQRGLRPREGAGLRELISEQQFSRWGDAIARVLERGESESLKESESGSDGSRYFATSLGPVRRADEVVVGVVIVTRETTERVHADAEVRRLRQEFASREQKTRGSADVREVMHNAGNVLNGISVAASMLEAHIHEFRAERLIRVMDLLDAHKDELATFLESDPKGSRIMPLMRVLANHFVDKERDMVTELGILRESVAHLAQLIRSQRRQSETISLAEEVTAKELIDKALLLDSHRWDIHGIEVDCHIDDLPVLVVDKHRVLEILVNLLSNAWSALVESDRDNKKLTLRVEAVDAHGLRFQVEDNGIGIAKDVQKEIYQFGFTTKERGSGIGLHSSANAAGELGGRLYCHSDGPGTGATFTLELPLRAVQARP